MTGEDAERRMTEPLVDFELFINLYLIIVRNVLLIPRENI